ncbi:MAG: molybdopterin dinucleotide binding domain-containing protein [Halobacteriaceae archaeon]
MLTGSVGTEGGTSPNAWHEFDPELPLEPPRQRLWDELQLPPEYPFAHYEMSFLLPYFLKEGRGKLAMYFTRVFNPVYTYPDGFSWIEALTDEDLVECHVALTPTWNETAYFADYVLPMGHSPERHDIQSQETHAATWVTYRQPVLREYAEREGQDIDRTYQANPGEVWEEDEFWLDLSWRIDEDGDLGIREYFESPYRDGEDGDPAQMTVDEYYRYIFEAEDNLVEAAAAEDMTPLEYMQHHGAFEASENEYAHHDRSLDESLLEEDDVWVDDYGTIRRGEAPEYDSTVDGSDVLGVMVDGEPKEGFPTPSGKQEFYSKTMAEWGWDDLESTIPHYLKSHVHPDTIDYEDGEMVLVPTFRLPPQIHSRSSNSKWLEEISHNNPVWLHTNDADRLGVETGDLVRVEGEIGYFVNEVWVTESIKPGIAAMSHHMGQWKVDREDGADIEEGGSDYGKVTVDLDNDASRWGMRQTEGIEPFDSTDPDSRRVWWNDGGVAQNLIHAPHPDPLSGMHCWHQTVTVRPAEEDDYYGDIFVDTDEAMAIYREWLEDTDPGPGPNGLRRPKWLKRPVGPPTEPGDDDAWYLGGPVGRPERWDADTTEE